MTLCLRSIRKHSGKYNLEVIVVDNGSGDGSLDYLRSIPWIRLLERPEERPQNWPLNVFTAWDRGLDVATGEYYLTMHSDVFVKSDNWLDPFLARNLRGAECGRNRVLEIRAGKSSLCPAEAGNRLRGRQGEITARPR